MSISETQICEALRELAKQTGATVQFHTTMARFSYSEKALATFTNKDVPTGIGIRVEAGKLVICGDNYGQETGYAKMTKLITGYATVYKVKLNAKMYKMPTSVKIRENEILLEVG